jgi:hypothetical protein
VSIPDTSSYSSRTPFGNTPSATPEAKKSTPVGAIAGGVIGGIAVLGAIIFGVFFLLRRKRNKTQSQVHAQPQAPQPPPPTQYYGHEQKPVGVAQVQQMPPPQQYHQVPQFYDPNAQTAYNYPMPEKTPAATNMQVNPYYADGNVSGPVSPVPMYTPSPAMSPGNGPMNTAPPVNVNELSSPVPVYTPPSMSPANVPGNNAPLASVNELPTHRM